LRAPWGLELVVGQIPGYPDFVSPKAFALTLAAGLSSLNRPTQLTVFRNWAARGPESIDEEAARVIDALSAPQKPRAEAIRAAKNLGGGNNPFYFFLHTLNFLTSTSAFQLESGRYFPRYLDRIGEAFYTAVQHDDFQELSDDWAGVAAILFTCGSVVNHPDA